MKEPRSVMFAPTTGCPVSVSFTVPVIVPEDVCPRVVAVHNTRRAIWRKDFIRMVVEAACGSLLEC